MRSGSERENIVKEKYGKQNFKRVELLSFSKNNSNTRCNLLTRRKKGKDHKIKDKMKEMIFT